MRSLFNRAPKEAEEGDTDRDPNADNINPLAPASASTESAGSQSTSTAASQIATSTPVPAQTSSAAVSGVGSSAQSVAASGRPLVDFDVCSPSLSTPSLFLSRVVSVRAACTPSVPSRSCRCAPHAPLPSRRSRVRARSMRMCGGISQARCRSPVHSMAPAKLGAVRCLLV